MPEANDNTPRPAGYLGIAAATIFGLVAIEEGATKFFNDAPALWTALQNLAPAERKSPPAKPGVHPEPSSPERSVPPQPGTFGLADYLGEWRNRDPKTRGITRLWIHNEGLTLQLQVWGSCHPADCDWGTTNATAFAKDVGSRDATDIRSVEALFKTGFSESNVVMKLAEKATLTVEISTHFTDKSSRSDYQTTETLLLNVAGSR
jgi:hypothetical protein